MANIFGTQPPKIHYGNGLTFQMPLAEAGERDEDFPMDQKIYLNHPSRSLKRRKRGRRCLAKYRFVKLSNSDVYTFLAIADSDEPMYLEFTSFPRWYEVYVNKFKRGLSKGYNYSDQIEIEFIGVNLLKEHPNPDGMLLGFIYGRPIGLITMNEFSE